MNGIRLLALPMVPPTAFSIRMSQTGANGFPGTNYISVSSRTCQRRSRKTCRSPTLEGWRVARLCRAVVGGGGTWVAPTSPTSSPALRQTPPTPPPASRFTPRQRQGGFCWPPSPGLWVPIKNRTPGNSWCVCIRHMLMSKTVVAGTAEEAGPPKGQPSH